MKNNVVKQLVRAGMPMLALFLFNELMMNATSYDFQIRWSIIDIPLHFLGGMATAWAAWCVYGVLREAGKVAVASFPLLLFLIVAVVGLVGVVWEVYEMLHDIFYPGYLYQPSNWDTMKDLIVDVCGAVVFCCGLTLQWRKK